MIREILLTKKNFLTLISDARWSGLASNSEMDKYRYIYEEEGGKIIYNFQDKSEFSSYLSMFILDFPSDKLINNILENHFNLNPNIVKVSIFVKEYSDKKIFTEALNKRVEIELKFKQHILLDNGLWDAYYLSIFKNNLEVKK